MADLSGTQVSLQELERRIAEQEARAGERERVAREINALAHFVRTAGDELTRATDRLSRDVAERAEAIRVLASIAQRPGPRQAAAEPTLWSVQEGLVLARTAACAEAMHAWVRAEDKVARAIGRLAELKARLAGMPEGAEIELVEMRRWRAEMIARGDVLGAQASLPAAEQGARRAIAGD